MFLKGQAQITVRDAKGKVKSQTNHDNALAGNVKSGLLAALSGTGSYSSGYTPTRIGLVTTNNLSPSDKKLLGNRSISTTGGGSTYVVSFSVDGFVSPGTGLDKVQFVYLLSDSNVVGFTTANPNPQFDQGDTIDIVYKIILAPSSSRVSTTLLERLSKIIQGQPEPTSGGTYVPQSQYVHVSHATLFDGVTAVTGKQAIAYEIGSSASCNIKFAEIPSSNVDKARFYVNEAGNFIEVYNQDIDVPTTFTLGDNLIIPFSITVS